MRETSPRGWHRWRVTVVQSAPAPHAFDPMARRGGAPIADPAPPARAADQELRGPDGIRHELVARIRQQIADGTYDTEDKWLLAEEALLRRVAGCT